MYEIQEPVYATREDSAILGEILDGELEEFRKDDEFIVVYVWERHNDTAVRHMVLRVSVSNEELLPEAEKIKLDISRLDLDFEFKDLPHPFVVKKMPVEFLDEIDGEVAPILSIKTDAFVLRNELLNGTVCTAGLVMNATRERTQELALKVYQLLTCTIEQLTEDPYVQRVSKDCKPIRKTVLDYFFYKELLDCYDGNTPFVAHQWFEEEKKD